ncbi:MAG: hypothetical protein MZV64_27890 [Ignavibacteriales bacterium]|nr:hypothetical protein [Ignavibacteriales bacterium]
MLRRRVCDDAGTDLGVPGEPLGPSGRDHGRPRPERHQHPGALAGGHGRLRNLAPHRGPAAAGDARPEGARVHGRPHRDGRGIELPRQTRGLWRDPHPRWTAGMNVEYMYAFVQKASENAVIIFRFDNPARAVQVLQEAGMRVLAGEDIYAM